VERLTPKIEALDVSADLVVLAASCLQKDPKLRLALVRWEDFDPPAFRAEQPTDDPKSRIRRRLAIAQQATQGVDNSAEQKSRSARRTVDKLQVALQAEIHQECTASGLFPQLEIHDGQRPGASIGRFKVNFSCSPEHALTEVLSIFFAIELLDENSEAVSISYSAAVSQADLDWELVNSANSRVLFKGVYNQVAVGERLKQVLYSLLDGAQQISRGIEAARTEAVWLTTHISNDSAQPQ
jgi:hypothetical protein